MKLLSTNPDLFVQSGKWPAYSVHSHTYPICPRSKMKLVGIVQHLHTTPPLPRTDEEWFKPEDNGAIFEKLSNSRPILSPELFKIRWVRRSPTPPIPIPVTPPPSEEEVAEIIVWLCKTVYWDLWHEARDAVSAVVGEARELAEFELDCMGYFRVKPTPKKAAPEIEAEPAVEKEAGTVSFNESDEVHEIVAEEVQEEEVVKTEADIISECIIDELIELCLLLEDTIDELMENCSLKLAFHHEIKWQLVAVLADAVEARQEVIGFWEEYFEEITHEPTPEPTPEPEPEPEVEEDVEVEPDARLMPVLLGVDSHGIHIVYCAGMSVVIKPLGNLGVARIYCEHAQPVRVARFSPSGQYVASADIAGGVRVWDPMREDSLHCQHKLMAGPVRDLCWSSDGAMLCVVGEGVTDMMHHGQVIHWETGARLQTLGSAPMMTCAFSPCHLTPHRLVTGAMDGTVTLYSGTALTPISQVCAHTGEVSCVIFSKRAEKMASAGRDGRICVYNGLDGQRLTEITRDYDVPAHSQPVSGLEFNANSMRLLSTCLDGAVTVWELLNKTPVEEIILDEPQVGCTWVQHEPVTSISPSGLIVTAPPQSTLLTVSLTGDINYFEQNNVAGPLRITSGHKSGIQAIICESDPSGVGCRVVYTGCRDGRIVGWQTDTWSAQPLTAAIHSHPSDTIVEPGTAPPEGVLALSLAGMQEDCDTLVSCGSDYFVHFTHIKSRTLKEKVEVPSLPVSVVGAEHSDMSVVCCVNHVLLVRGYTTVCEEMVDYDAACVAIHPNLQCFAVAASHDHVYVYSIKGENIYGLLDMSFSGIITALQYNPAGDMLVVGDGDGSLTHLSLPHYEATPCHAHCAKVLCMAYSPDGRRMASCAKDHHLIVWDVAVIDKRHARSQLIREPHGSSTVSRVVWLSNTHFLSTGADGSLKTWSVV